MKKLAIILTALIFMAGFATNAQTRNTRIAKQDQSERQGMMMQDGSMRGGGMMQGMMNRGACPMGCQMMNQDMPMQKFMMMVNHLPDIQEQLSLTDEQVDKLYDLQTGFKKQLIDYQAESRKKQKKLKSLLKDMASSNQVRSQMKDCADIKINMKIAAYETANKMNTLLTNDQKEQMNDMILQMNQSQDGMMQRRGGMMNNNQRGMMRNRNNQ